MSADLSLLITRDGDGDWCVWMSLPDHDPELDAFGFVIGIGATRDAAVADAVAELEGVGVRLQAPAGAVEEREIA